MNAFPLSGVIGIIAEGAKQIELALAHELGAVEIRGDLLLDAGLDAQALIDIVAKARAQRLGCLFTLRHPTHGGKFAGNEGERVKLNLRALEAGADIVDAELGTDAARRLLGEGAPVLLSHHDFEGMPDARELDALTQAMREAGPRGMKLVPTASKIGDAARMLEWVGSAEEVEVRIGFAMGAAGACSRILTIAFGSPVTYASFGQSVAPGQVALIDLKDVYRADRLDADTRVYGVAGAGALASDTPFTHNPAFASCGINAVCVPFETEDAGDLFANLDTLRIDGLNLDAPLDRQAPGLAGETDIRSMSIGAANTLLVERIGGETRTKACTTSPSAGTPLSIWAG